MLNFDKNLIDFYISFVERELYKSKFPKLTGLHVNKVVFLNKTNKFTYWFPFGSGRKSSEYPDKLKSKSITTFHTVYNFSDFNFLSSLSLFIALKANLDIFSFIQSSKFKKYLSLVNESSRKHQNKRFNPPVRNRAIMSWKYRNSNNYSTLQYYFTYEPHRNISRFRKVNFFSQYSWASQPKNWIFSYKNMRTSFFRWRKTQRFEHKFFRFKGMSFKFWAKQQLQYNYLNSLSSDLLTDVYNSNFFTSSQLPVSNLEFTSLLSNKDQKEFLLSFIFWLFLESYKSSKNLSLPSYFSNSYNFNQFSHTVKYRNMKNFFAASTPKYAHAYYKTLHDVYGGWVIIRNFFSLFKPTYWNLRKGLDSYPHEYWDWEAALWWADSIPFMFSRFFYKNSQLRSSYLDLFDNTNFVWFYKSWFHEEIFTEFQSSYYNTYYNIDYLTPNWRIYTEYPKRRLGHFDPHWRERIHEYVIYQYMNLFHPSTKRYFINYSNHPSYVDTRSFLVLNFAWKPGSVPLFLTQFRPKLRKILRSSRKLDLVYDKFRPEFSALIHGLESIKFFPISLLFLDKRLKSYLSEYECSLIFILNSFSKSKLTPPRQIFYFEFLFVYITKIFFLNLGKIEFINNFNNGNFNSYSEIFELLLSFGLKESDILNLKNRAVAEYVAFKRLFTLIISDYGV